jgi:hypothetical protein
MSVVITWTVTAMDCYPNEGGNTNVVFNVHWTCFGVDSEYINNVEKIYTGKVYATCEVPGPGDPFTPYPDLTQDQVLGWIWANGVNKDATEAIVLQQIAEAKNPPVVTPPLPWA